MAIANTQKAQYLEMVQGVISRMASNSFKIKNWAILVFAGLLSLYFSQGRHQILLLAISISFIFYILDAYYLSLEREFCKKYNNIVHDNEKILFDMKIDHNIQKWAKALKSPSMIPYWAIIIPSIIIMSWQPIQNFFNNIIICI